MTPPRRELWTVLYLHGSADPGLWTTALAPLRRADACTRCARATEDLARRLSRGCAKNTDAPGQTRRGRRI